MEERRKEKRAQIPQNHELYYASSSSTTIPTGGVSVAPRTAFVLKLEPTMTASYFGASSGPS